jgi:peptidoglycan/xylan/chitin deacetylase (PgdA/CDA1 family)
VRWQSVLVVLLATWVLALQSAVAQSLSPATAQGAAGYPRLAGTLPDIEGPILRALQAAGGPQRIIQVAADTNGNLTVASLVFTYSAGVPQPLPILQTYAWTLIRQSFAAVPTLDEVELTAFHQGSGLFDADRTDVTFSAAVSRREMTRLGPNIAATDALRTLPRVWYHLLLLQTQVSALEAHRQAQPKQPLQPERPPAFAGSPTERAVEAQHTSQGLVRGGVVAGKLYRGDPVRPVLALTFDDGPVPIYTTLLLDTLGRLKIKGTFFLIGRRVQQYPYFVQALVAGGHELANHTFHHLNLTRIPPDQIPAEIARAQEVIAAVTGRTPRYFRPPGGDYDANVLRAARNLNLITVFWTDDPADYARPGSSVLERRLLSRVSNGGILLPHQGVEDTIRILPVAVEALRRGGFTITTVTGLLGRGS